MMVLRRPPPSASRARVANLVACHSTSLPRARNQLLERCETEESSRREAPRFFWDQLERELEGMERASVPSPPPSASCALAGVCALACPLFSLREVLVPTRLKGKGLRSTSSAESNGCEDVCLDLAFLLQNAPRLRENTIHILLHCRSQAAGRRTAQHNPANIEYAHTRRRRAAVAVSAG